MSPQPPSRVFSTVYTADELHVGRFAPFRTVPELPLLGDRARGRHARLLGGSAAVRYEARYPFVRARRIDH
jgi:hypothetical protein